LKKQSLQKVVELKKNEKPILVGFFLVRSKVLETQIKIVFASEPDNNDYADFLLF
jgi:hypothetical protein